MPGLRRLEICYRGGRPLAAYLHLSPRAPGSPVGRTLKVGGLVVDFDRSGAPVGIEIPAPNPRSVSQVEELLSQLGLPALEPGERTPLLRGGDP